MDFGKVLTRAWEIIWKHKILWAFGLFASCSSQQATSSFNRSGGGGGTGFQFDGDEIPYIPPEYQRFFMDIQHYFQENAETIFTVGLILVVFFIIVGLFFYLLGNLGKIGLIKGTLLAEGGAETMSFSEVFEASKPFFWRIVGLNLLLAVALIVMGVVLWVIFAAGILVTFGLGLLCLIPLICLMVPFFWILGIVVRQANIALVLEDLDILAALERGWNFTRENLGNVIVMGIILYVGAAIVGFIIGIPQALSIIPIVTGFITGDFMSDPDALMRGISATVAISLIYLPIFLALRGVLVAYIDSAWTLTYLEHMGKADFGDEEPPQLEEVAAAS